MVGLVRFCKGLVGLGTPLGGFCKGFVGLVMICKGLVGLGTPLVGFCKVLVGLIRFCKGVSRFRYTFGRVL